jgi:hypothetical protein
MCKLLQIYFTHNFIILTTHKYIGVHKCKHMEKEVLIYTEMQKSTEENNFLQRFIIKIKQPDTFTFE